MRVKAPRGCLKEASRQRGNGTLKVLRTGRARVRQDGANPRWRDPRGPRRKRQDDRSDAFDGPRRVLVYGQDVVRGTHYGVGVPLIAFDAIALVPAAEGPAVFDDRNYLVDHYNQHRTNRTRWALFHKDYPGRHVLCALGITYVSQFGEKIPIPPDIRETIVIPPIPRNMHPEHNTERRVERAKQLAKRYAQSTHVAYVDAAEYPTHRAMVLAIVWAPGHSGLAGNENAHDAARAVVYRARQSTERDSSQAGTAEGERMNRRPSKRAKESEGNDAWRLNGGVRLLFRRRRARPCLMDQNKTNRKEALETARLQAVKGSSRWQLLHAGGPCELNRSPRTRNKTIRHRRALRQWFRASRGW
ncbi:hypothetical protein HPB50_008080 [Hyalomma asiaticum]|uniref:Uncharacterized protein n=1 Tax=Hyalomma asiaticum TaxID=266040 RepID=A0ACB7RUZ1_HYAAI|nr:hypothetical protein HPB50_008080 [Hyalomma asiaticum]